MTGENEIKCPHCGETKNIRETTMKTFNGDVYSYKCLKCGVIFN